MKKNTVVKFIGNKCDKDVVMVTVLTTSQSAKFPRLSPAATRVLVEEGWKCKVVTLCGVALATRRNFSWE